MKSELRNFELESYQKHLIHKLIYHFYNVNIYMLPYNGTKMIQNFGFFYIYIYILCNINATSVSRPSLISAPILIE